jgi:glucose-6-phosphate 1-dehydrogenase
MGNHSTKPKPVKIVIFGAGGDLTQRKLMPALYNLYLDKLMPDDFAIIGVDIKDLDDDGVRKHIHEGIDEFSRRGKADKDTWAAFEPRLSYLKGDFTQDKTYTALAKMLAGTEDWEGEAGHIFYLAIPPFLIEPISQHLYKAKLMHNVERDRLVVEKPFGHDLDSARELDQMLTRDFHESQIYRIDHYLGKETVQNILAFRFANAIFEPTWDRRYIDHIQITVAENIGVEHRGGYYDHAGALRDMIQNHLLQILCLVAMEPPVSFDADEVRNKKVEVLRAVRRIPAEQVHQYAVRGQYGAGWTRNEHVAAYNTEEGVDPESRTETFAALKLYIDNWRWQGVPFYLRTGKRLPTRASQVAIVFQPAPNQPFPAIAIENWRPNRLLIDIQPEENISIGFQAKRPGPYMRLSSVDMEFSYQEAFKIEPPEAYETLLLDVIEGDATLFMRADQVEAAWSLLMPVLDVWESVPPSDFPNYAAGTWGPEGANALIAHDGRNWYTPKGED